MLDGRRSGILLHPTCLPSPCGMGDMGPEAERFLRFLETSGQTVWQVLPLGVTDPALGNSPYNSPSAFAGNPLLVSPELLFQDGLLEAWDLEECEDCPPGRADHVRAGSLRRRLLGRAFVRFFQEGRGDVEAFHRFRREEGHWVEDFSLFMAIKDRLRGLPWTLWPEALRDREPDALEEQSRSLEREIEAHIFGQFLFFRQWARLRAQAAERGVCFLGDLPIYVSMDSADVWTNPEFFQLGLDRRPLAVAGVPPDYFSETGQFWGNPLYDWETMRQDGFGWWIRRLRHSLRLFDQVRIDHFRGLLHYWSIPADEKTAMGGQWEEVPSAAFFGAIKTAFPEMPFVAENLGLITPDVVRAMEDLSLPGMLVLLFAFGEGGGRNPYMPHNHVRNNLVYTGTHDNNTVRGWWEEEADPQEKERVRSYLGYDPETEGVHRAFVRMAFASVAGLSIFPLQDLMGLGAGARMNRPSSAGGNWDWRLDRAEDYEVLADELGGLTELYGRAFRQG